MFSSVDLSFTIQNNVNYPVQINVLGNPYNLLDTANSTTEYRWDFTSFTFNGENQIVIQYKLNSETSFTTYSGQLGSQTLQAIVDVLNNLGIGYFNLYTEIGSTYIGTYNDNYTFNQLNVFSSIGIINTSFVVGTGFNNNVYTVAVQGDGKVIIGGDFTSYNGTGANYIIRLNTDGSVDGSFLYGIGFDSFVSSIAIQSDGKIIVCGQFTDYDGTPLGGIVRLNSNGSIDGSFVTGSGFGGVPNSIAIQTDGKILLGGQFSTYDGTGADNIIRLNSNGSIDGSFVYGTGFNSAVLQIAIQTDGKIICVGDFSSYDGTGANYIIRLNSNGSVDGSFVYGTGFSNRTESVAIQTNGKIVVGGQYSTYKGVSSVGIIRLETNGNIDSTFVVGTGFNDFSGWDIYGIAIQSDGKILLGGFFVTYNGTSANNIIRLNSNGSVDNSFDYGTGFNLPINAISLSTTKIYVGGEFTTFDSQSYNRIISLNQ